MKFLREKQFFLLYSILFAIYVLFGYMTLKERHGGHRLSLSHNLIFSLIYEFSWQGKNYYSAETCERSKNMRTNKITHTLVFSRK